MSRINSLTICLKMIKNRKGLLSYSIFDTFDILKIPFPQFPQEVLNESGQLQN